jgi:hypothetical protein
VVLAAGALVLAAPVPMAVTQALDLVLVLVRAVVAGSRVLVLEERDQAPAPALGVRVAMVAMAPVLRAHLVVVHGALLLAAARAQVLLVLLVLLAVPRPVLPARVPLDPPAPTAKALSPAEVLGLVLPVVAHLALPALPRPAPQVSQVLLVSPAPSPPA